MLSHFHPITTILLRFIYCAKIYQLTKTKIWLSMIKTLKLIKVEHIETMQSNRKMVIKLAKSQDNFF